MSLALLFHSPTGLHRLLHLPSHLPAQRPQDGQHPHSPCRGHRQLHALPARAITLSHQRVPVREARLLLPADVRSAGAAVDAAVHQGAVGPWPARCGENSGSDGDDPRACGEGVQEVTGVVPGREPPPLHLRQVSALVLGVHASADLNLYLECMLLRIWIFDVSVQFSSRWYLCAWKSPYVHQLRWRWSESLWWGGARGLRCCTWQRSALTSGKRAGTWSACFCRFESLMSQFSSKYFM